MQNNYSFRHPETDRDTFTDIDREIQKQQAIARYRSLKNFKNSELNLDDKLFMENFEAAMRYMWRVQRLDDNC